MDDRQWMYRRVCDGFVTQEFYDGITIFVNFAFSQALPVTVVRCPCVKCDNRKFQNKEVILEHLLRKGFTSDYFRWIYHGEAGTEETSLPESSHNNVSANPYREMLMDAMGENYVDNNEDFDYVNDEAPNSEAKKFYDMLRDVSEPLYNGCKTETVLSACVNMMVLKAQTRLTQAGFNFASSMIKNFLPEDNKLNNNFYEAKKMLKPLGLGYEKIDVCHNFCMLYYKENEAKIFCDICKEPRYKLTNSSGCRKKNPKYDYVIFLSYHV